MALTKIKLNTMVTGTLPDANIPDDITIDTAAAVPASGLTGNTLASGVTASSLTSVGTLTSLTVDDMTFDGSTISDGGDLTFDIGGDIILDADDEHIFLKDGGTTIGNIDLGSQNITIRNSISNADLIFRGNDGGTEVEAMRINYSGNNVGIGTSSIGAKLHVADNRSTAYSSTGEPAETIIAHNKNGTDDTGVNNYASLAFAVADGATSQGFINYKRTGNNKGEFTFSQRTGSSSYAEHLKIENDGTVSCAGAFQPAGNVTVGGNITTTGSSITVDPASGDAVLALQHSSQTLRIDQNSIRTTTNSPLTIFTNNTAGNGMYIATDGNVAFGTTTARAVSGYRLLTVNHATNGAGINFQQNGTNYGAIYNVASDMYYDADTHHIFRTGGAMGGTTRFRINSTGFVGIGASPNALLDINKSTTSTSAPTGDEGHESFRLMLANPSLTNYATNALGFSMYNGEVCATIDASTLYDGNYRTGIRFQTRNDASGGLTEKVNINYGGNLIVRNNEVGNAGLIRNATSASYGDDAYNSITSGEAGAFMLYAYDYASGQGACFFCNYSDTVVKVAGHSNWTNSDSDGYFCVFKGSSSHTVTVKNRIGSTRNLGVLLVGVNPRQGA